MRVYLLVLTLVMAGCGGGGFGVDAGNHPAARNPADEVGGYPVPETCVEKDPVTRLCK